ncbi:relaxin-3 receptor 1-like [Heterodontus francisci]|uniref:relaxin-3 receptor 1-like n=1 Tax=Heterodontus francisci TaxID=7792 RepID=UPI00355C5D38
MDTEQSVSSLDLSNASSVPSLRLTTDLPWQWSDKSLLDELVILPSVSNSLRIVTALIYSVVCALGLFGNLLVLYLIRGINGRNRSTVNLFVFNLALADFHFVLVLPFWAAEIALDHSWPFGNAMCKLVLFATVLNMYASVFFLTAMSVSRYCSVSQTLRAGRTSSRPCKVKWVSLMIWLLAGAASLPPTIYSRTVQIEGEELCIQKFPNEGYRPEVYQMQRIVVAFIVPLAVICVSYILILHLIKSQKVNGNPPDAPSNVTKLVILIVLTFFLCWLPNHIITFWGVLVKLELLHWNRAYYITHSYVHPLTICLAHANSCLNPVIYCLMRKEFRESLKSLLWSKCPFPHPWTRLATPCCRGQGERGQVVMPLGQIDSHPICDTRGDSLPSNTSAAPKI